MLDLIVYLIPVFAAGLAGFAIGYRRPEPDAERYRWLLANYARGDGYAAIDAALNDGEANTQLSPAIDAAMAKT